MSIWVGQFKCKVKLSSGADSCVVVQPEHQILEQLETITDEALTASTRMGRNCLVTWITNQNASASSVVQPRVTCAQHAFPAFFLFGCGRAMCLKAN